MKSKQGMTNQTQIPNGVCCSLEQHTHRKGPFLRTGYSRALRRTRGAQTGQGPKTAQPEEGGEAQPTRIRLPPTSRGSLLIKEAPLFYSTMTHQERFGLSDSLQAYGQIHTGKAIQRLRKQRSQSRCENGLQSNRGEPILENC